MAAVAQDGAPGGLTAGLSRTEKREVFQMLRHMRVLEADRPIAATMAEEAQALADTLPALRDRNPRMAKEIDEAIGATVHARARVEAEVAADRDARKLPASHRASGQFLASLRRASGGNAQAMGDVEAARVELLEAHRTAGAADRAPMPLNILSVAELVASTARQHEERVRLDPASSDEDRQSAKDARKFAEFHSMRNDEALRERSNMPGRNNEPDAGENIIDPTASFGARPRSQALPNNYALHKHAIYHIGDPHHPLMKDDGRRLRVPRQFDTKTIQAVIAIAEARGWGHLTLHGDPEFRRAVWMAAAARGFDVQGYRPSAVERAQMERTQNAHQQHKSASQAFLGATHAKARIEAMKEHPDLKRAFALEAAAHAFTRERVSQGQRNELLKRMRQAIAHELAQGQTLPAVHLKADPTKQRNAKRPARSVEHDR